MAGFHFNGADTIAATFLQLAQLTPDDTLSILRPAAQLLKDRQQQQIDKDFTQRTGSLRESITLEEKTSDDRAEIVISLKGKHPNSTTGRRRGKRRSNGHYSGTNAEVGYILEQGSPRIKARYWLQNANEQADEEVNKSMADAWDAYLASKGV